MARIVKSHAERPTPDRPNFHNRQTVVESDDGRHYLVSSSVDPFAGFRLDETN